MLGFFKSVVFKRTVKKYIDPNAGFIGVVGMRPNEVKKKSTRLQQRRPGKWTPVESREEDPLASVLGDMEAREKQENDRRVKDRQEEDKEDEDDEDDEEDEEDEDDEDDEDDEEDEEDDVEDSGSDEDVDVADQALAEEEGAQISKDLGIFIVNSVEEKTKLSRKPRRRLMVASSSGFQCRMRPSTVPASP
ncbi:MAG: hypothetical protein JOS17DRAFT_612729 [Linnemannia elongata]|nr:MAG: hypothetical protein JOS17DRAFT_612729 [Linnemannia elongata]